MPAKYQKDLTLMKYSPLLTSLCLIILLSACSTNPVSVSMSTSRFDNPEVSSEPLSVNLALGSGSRTILNIETDDKNFSGNDIYAFARGNITATKGLEISISSDVDSATHIGIKYQFYGAHTEQSTKGNISQAFTLGYERTETYESYYSGGDYIAGESLYCNYVAESGYWQHDTDVYDIAWVVGYKLTDRDIIYGGPFYQWAQLSGYKSTANNSTEPLESDGYMVGANIAIEHRFSFGLGLAGEIVYGNLNWGHYSQNDTSFNFKIDYQF